MKKKSVDITLLIIMIVGFSLLLYPSIANWWNSRHSSFAVAEYVNEIKETNVRDYSDIWLKASEFNKQHSGADNRVTIDNDYDEYLKQLSIGSDMMGYIEIPLISVKLPIYHGTEESSLRAGVGHLEWTSLPTGEIGTHSALSSHRGLPSAKLFSDLDKLGIGDYFILNIIDKQFIYKIDQILTVLPEDMEALSINPEKDLCTLVTCTPYGVNSHRLLVRGERVDSIESGYVISSEAIRVSSKIVAAFVSIPLLIIAIIYLLRKKEN